MSAEDELLDRVLYYVSARGKNRSVVMYGYHPELQKIFESNGLRIFKIFTGNLNLLANPELDCIHEDEMYGKTEKYYVIVPFFLPDGGTTQRAKLKQYGYHEYKDYIFYPQSTIANESSVAQFKKEIDVLRKKNEELDTQINVLRQSIASEKAYNDLFTWYLTPVNEEDERSARKRFFRNLPPAEGTLRNMQLAGAILLSKLDEVCRANSIQYWISFGTLIGAIRHHGFVPWDDDTDVCMMREDAMRLTEIMENNEDFFVSHIFAEFDDNLNHCVQFRFRRGAPYCLDIFIYDYCSELNHKTIQRQAELNAMMAEESQEIRRLTLNVEEKNKKYGELLNKYIELSKKEAHTSNILSDHIMWAIDNFRCNETFQSNCAINDIFPLQKVVFEGLELNAPRNAEDYLTKKYGDIYSLPNDILSHVHFKLNSAEEMVLGEILKKYGYLLNNEG